MPVPKVILNGGTPIEWSLLNSQAHEPQLPRHYKCGQRGQNFCWYALHFGKANKEGFVESPTSVGGRATHKMNPWKDAQFVSEVAPPATIKVEEGKSVTR